MFYERKVIYLDYLVKNERCGNAGFLKIEVRGNICNITINVSDLHATQTLLVKVYLVGDGQERELCEVKMAQGKGMKQILQQDMHDIGRTGIAYEALEAVRIPLGAEREIYGVVGKRAETAKVVGQERNMQDVAVESAVVKSAEAYNARDKHQGNDCENNANVQELVGKAQDDIYVQGIRVDNERMQEVNVTTVIDKFEENVHSDKKVTHSTTEQSISREVAERTDVDGTLKNDSSTEYPLCDDKWKQLWAIYPHITPFHDERKYLSVGPNDFVILPGKYFKMANNSFLLHGYHNYNHLILKKMEYRGETRYYIGVPGNFYDREKQVAIMFGFESFESLEEPARTGDYGYYLMRIEL